MALTPVSIDKAFKKRLAKKPAHLQASIMSTIAQLRKDWRHPGLRAHEMGGHPGVFEARIDGGNRLSFHWENDTIVLRNHCNHDMLRKP